MKQTKGALTMLLAQYRAVYMNALKICVASVLSASALIAPNLAIADATQINQINAKAQNPLEYTEGDINLSEDVTLSKDKVLIVSADANKKVHVNAQNHTITFKGDGSTANIEVGKNGGGLSFLDISNATLKDAANANVVVNDKGFLKLSAKNFAELQKGRLTLNSTNHDNFGTIEITDGEITLNDKNTADQAPADAGKAYINGKLTGKKLNIDSNTINLGDNANLTFEDIAFKENTLTMAKGEITATKTLSSQHADKTLTINNTAANNSFNLGKNLQSQGTIDLSSLTIEGVDNNNDIGSVTIIGTWDANQADINVKSGTLRIDEDSTLTNIKKLTVGQQGSQQPTGRVYLEDADDLIADQLELHDKSAVNIVGGKGHLIINGTSAKDDVVIGDNVGIYMASDAKMTFANNAIDDIFDAKTKSLTATGDKLAAAYTSHGNAVLTFDLDANTSLTKDEAAKLVEKFTNNHGFISLGNASISNLPQGGTASWSDVKGIAALKISNNSLEKTKIDAKLADVADGIYGSFGSFAITDAKTTKDVKIAKATILNNASGNNNNYVSVDGQVANLVLENDTYLTLANGGNVGDIKVASASGQGNHHNLAVIGGTTNIASIKGNSIELNFEDSTTTVKGVITADEVMLKDATLNVAGAVNVNEIGFLNSNAVFEDNVTIKNPNNGSDLPIANSKVLFKKNVNVAGINPNYIVNDSVVNIDGQLVSDGLINVGYKTNVTTTSGNTDDTHTSDYYNIFKDSSGRLYVKDGSKLTNDIDVISGTTQSSIMALGDDKVHNNIHVGENSIVIYGATGNLNSIDAIDTYLKTNYLLNEDGSTKNKKALAIFNKAISVEKGKTINLNYKQDAAQSDNVQTFALNARSNIQRAGTKTGILLGEGSSLVVTADALKDSSKPAITLASGDTLHFEKNDAATKAYITLAGVTANNGPLNIINKEALANVTGDILVESANAQLSAKLNKDGTTTELKINSSKVHDVNYMASSPVKEYIKKILEDAPGFTDPEFKDSDMNNLAIALSEGNDHGRALEVASRFALYGQSFKTTELAVNNFNNVRQNLINNDGLIAKTQSSDGLSLFVAPTYQKAKSSSFNAQGQTYGGDINLTNVVLGANFDLNSNIKLGTMFSIGKGDSKGSGIASNVKTDSDVYGGSLFAGYKYDNLQVTGDISYVQIKSDIETDFEGSKKFNKFTSDVDSNAISLGVNAAYTFSLDDTSYVKPYAGLRYTKYDIDDYDVKAKDQTFMQSKFDSINVLSVPVGLVYGAKLQKEDMTLIPTVDLGITFNTGDTDIKSYAIVATKNDDMSLETEALDSIVFGIKANLKAQFKNNFDLNLGMGYEHGSSTKNIILNAGFNYNF